MPIQAHERKLSGGDISVDVRLTEVYRRNDLGSKFHQSRADELRM
jgi:hypothetical protein